TMAVRPEEDALPWSRGVRRLLLAELREGVYQTHRSVGPADVAVDARPVAPLDVNWAFGTCVQALLQCGCIFGCVVAGFANDGVEGAFVHAAESLAQSRGVSLQFGQQTQRVVARERAVNAQHVSHSSLCKLLARLGESSPELGRL